MTIEYKVIETKVEGDWCEQLIEMPYETFQLITEELHTRDSGVRAVVATSVGDGLLCNPWIPDGFVWDSFTLLDPNSKYGGMLSNDDPHPEGLDVTMFLTSRNESSFDEYECGNLKGRTDRVSLDELFDLRFEISDAISPSVGKGIGDGWVDSCIEGDGFNIVFPKSGKVYRLRCEYIGDEETE